jgi:hypothetical protein
MTGTAKRLKKTSPRAASPWQPCPPILRKHLLENHLVFQVRHHKRGAPPRVRIKCAVVGKGETKRCSAFGPIILRPCQPYPCSSTLG